MEDVDRGEAGAAEQFELVGEGARGVFLLDVGGDLGGVFWAAEGGEVVGPALVRKGFDGGVFVGDHIEDPEGPAGAEPGVELGEGLFPFGVGAEVMEDGSGEKDVEGVGREVGFADVGLDGGGREAGGSGACGGAGEHGLAEVEEGDVLKREFLVEAEGEVAGAAADVEDVGRVGGDGGRALSDQFEAEGGVDGGGLASVEVREAFDVGVEAGADFVDRGFVHSVGSA